MPLIILVVVLLVLSLIETVRLIVEDMLDGDDD